MTAYDPRAIANHFLDIAESKRVGHGALQDDLTPLKLQKLVYFAHGWNLALKGEPLIDEQVEAWTHGPVIPSLYFAFRNHGNQPIDAKYVDVEYAYAMDGTPFVRSRHEPSLRDHPGQEAYTRSLLDRIWEVYGHCTASQLSTMTHQPGTPWDTVVKKWGGKVPRGTDISMESIKAYFEELASAKETV